MATLHDQPPRQQPLSRYYNEVWNWIRTYMGASDPKDVTPEQWQAAAAVVRTSLAIQSADTFNERISGAVTELTQAIAESAFADPEGAHRDQGIADALFALADGLTRTLRDLGNGNAATPMGAIEAFGLVMKEAADGIAGAIQNVAEGMDV